MHIEIEIQRPIVTATFLVAIVGGVVWMQSGANVAVAPAPVVAQVSTVGPQDLEPIPATAVHVAMGGEETDDAEKSAVAEQDLHKARAEQALLKRREEILRYQLLVLEEERRLLGDTVNPELEEEFRESTRALSELLMDQRKAEQFLLSSYNQIWDVRGRAVALGRALHTGVPTEIILQWPVEPIEGISAYFHDAAYEELFGFTHEGIDVPVLQGTIVTAAHDGVVTEVMDNGLGFNAITIQHEDGFATLYGHITDFIAEEGDRVEAGDPIAYSGGRPGSKGAGFSTGPHLHLELLVTGVTTDPLEYLPSLREAVQEQRGEGQERQEEGQ
ncbi:MAG: M23 family metallopeptidase [Candidatus Peregrinibacteria bacterium]|nr:M23 family metallopeptidase [Candidatus Peregrinibacteria bacterium]